MSDGTATATAAASTEGTKTEATDTAATSLLGGAPDSTDSKSASADKTEGTGDAAKDGDAKAGDTKAAAPALVDEKWEPKTAEGMTRDAAVVGEFKKLAQELKLSPEAAQKLVEFSDAQEKSRQALVSEADAAWKKELQEDKELGGAKLKQTTESARRLIRSLKSGPELVHWLDEMSLGNATPLVRAFAELAARTSEDNINGTLTERAPEVDAHQARINKTYGIRKE